MKKILALLVLVVPLICRAQFPNYGLPVIGDMLTNNPALIATNAAITINVSATTNFVTSSALTNVGVAAIRIPKGGSMAFLPLICQTNNVLSGSNIVFNFNTSADGTNWSTSNPITFTLAPTTNSVQGVANSACRAYTNFSAVTLANVPWIRLDSITTICSNHLWLSNTTYVIYP